MPARAISVECANQTKCLVLLFGGTVFPGTSLVAGTPLRMGKSTFTMLAAQSWLCKEHKADS